MQAMNNHQNEGKSKCWKEDMKDQRARLYSVGDFVGYVECVGKHRRQEPSEKKWRLMQVSDRLSSGDVRLLDRMQIEIYRNAREGHHSRHILALSGMRGGVE